MSENEMDEEQFEEKLVENALLVEKMGYEPCTLRVRNIKKFGKDELVNIFSTFGDLKKCRVFGDVAFIHFSDQTSADLALRGMQENIFGLKVSRAEMSQEAREHTSQTSEPKLKFKEFDMWKLPIAPTIINPNFKGYSKEIPKCTGGLRSPLRLNTSHSTEGFEKANVVFITTCCKECQRTTQRTCKSCEAYICGHNNCMTLHRKSH